MTEPIQNPGPRAGRGTQILAYLLLLPLPLCLLFYLVSFRPGLGLLISPSDYQGGWAFFVGFFWLPAAGLALILAIIGALLTLISWRRAAPRPVMALSAVPILVLLALGAFWAWNYWNSRENAAAVHFTHVSYSPEGKTILAIAEDGKVSLWDVESARQTGELPIPKNSVGYSGHAEDAHYSPDGKLIVTAHYGIAAVWDAASGQQIATLDPFGEVGTGQVKSAVFSPDGTRIITTIDADVYVFHELDYGARVWQGPDWKQSIAIKMLPTGPGEIKVSNAAYSPDGKLIATADDDGAVRVWDATTGQAVTILKSESKWLDDVWFTPDGKKVVTKGALNQNPVRVWDVVSGQSLLEFSPGSGIVAAAAMSPDGQAIVTAGDNGTESAIRIWDVSTGNLLREWTNVQTTSVTYSPDGNFILTTDHDGAMHIWEAATGREVRVLKRSVSLW